MQITKRSIDKMIEEQVQKWQIMRAEQKKEQAPRISVITISREPESRGHILTKRLAETFEFDIFHQEIIHGMAESTSVDNWILETLDEKGLNVLEHLVSSLVNRHHLWPDQHLKQLVKIVSAIGKQGRAIIVGRGANFILPPEERLSLRSVAPLEIRVKNASRDFSISVEEAKRRILRTESDRKAFIKKYFNSDISAPLNYDIVINTGKVSMDTAVELVRNALEG